MIVDLQPSAVLRHWRLPEISHETGDCRNPAIRESQHRWIPVPVLQRLRRVPFLLTPIEDIRAQMAWENQLRRIESRAGNEEDVSVGRMEMAGAEEIVRFTFKRSFRS